MLRDDDTKRRPQAYGRFRDDRDGGGAGADDRWAVVRRDADRTGLGSATAAMRVGTGRERNEQQQRQEQHTERSPAMPATLHA